MGRTEGKRQFLVWSVEMGVGNWSAPGPYAAAILGKAPRLLLYPQNRVLCGLGNPKFDDGLGWNLELLLRLWIKARARLPLLLHQLAETGQDKSPFFLIVL